MKRRADRKHAQDLRNIDSAIVKLFDAHEKKSPCHLSRAESEVILAILAGLNLMRRRIAKTLGVPL